MALQAGIMALESRMTRKDRLGVEESIVSVRNDMFASQLWRAGSGDPVLFLHGATGLRGVEPFVDALATQFTVYAPAHPGFETSTGLEHIDDMLDMVVYYNDWLDALHLESVYVVAHSLGGMIGAELAALSPQRVRKLVLANAVGLWLDEHPMADLFAMTPDQLASALWHDPQDAVAQAMMALPQEEHAQLAAYLLRMQHLSTTGKFLWPLPDKGLKKRLHRIHAPTLILWGQSDGLTPVAYAQAFQQQIVGARVTILPRCSHMPMYEDPTACASVVSDFLQS